MSTALMNLSVLRCPNCGALVESELLERKLGACGLCRAVLVLPSAPAVTLPASDTPSREAARSTRLYVEDTPGRLRARWHWLDANRDLERLAAVAIGAAGLGLASVLAFPGFVSIACGAGAAWLAYLALAHLLNHTQVEVREQVIRVQHRPLPWFKDQRFSGAQIDSLFCAGPAVWARLKTAASAVELVPAMDSRDEAEELRRRLERHLDL